MSKLNSIKALLQKVLATFAQVSTNKGLLSYASEGELPEIGEEIMIVDEEGNENKPEDGDYTTETGVVIVIKDGKVEEIREPEAPVAEEPAEPEAEPQAEPEAEPVVAEEAPIAEPEPEAESEPDEKDARIAELEARIAELEAENEELKKKLEEPASEPATEEFKKAIATPSTGNKRLDNLCRILNA